MALINVMIADDSSYIRHTVTRILEAEAGIVVRESFPNGRELLAAVNIFKPDVVVLDIDMPEMDGLQTLRALMKDCPLPVIMLSSFEKENELAVMALEIGAVDFLHKPGMGFTVEQMAPELVAKVKAAALIRHYDSNCREVCMKDVRSNKTLRNRAIAIASSTGGPKALSQVIPMLPAGMPVPVMVVQHMPETFTGPLAKRLAQSSKMTVKENEDGEELKPGTVYLARGGVHSRIDLKDGARRFRYTKDPTVKGVRPAADVTFSDMAESYSKGVLCVVLTGMGDDGSEGAARIKAKGGHVIAQDEKTSVIYGMPKAVVDRKIADETLPIYKISGRIIEIVESWIEQSSTKEN